MLNQRCLLETCLRVTDLKSNEDISVSVVVPFYNRARFLKRLLDSVAAQTLPADKVYIIDNGSSLKETLNAWHIIKAHSLVDKCIFTSSIGKGNANYARNLGYELATTKYVAFLDSDDWWEKQHLADSLSYLRKSDKVAVYSGAIVHNDSGYKIMKSIDVNVYDNPFSLIMSSKGYLAQTSSYIVNKSKLGFKVVWDESLKRHQDFDYFTSIFYRTSGWTFCSNTNVNVDWHQGGSKPENIDFNSHLAFYKKWHALIPNDEKKYYSLLMLHQSYKYKLDNNFKFFFKKELKANRYFNDWKCLIKSTETYMLMRKYLAPIKNFLLP